MSKFVEDVKSGLKGIRGAGDQLRGNAMAVADQAFDNNPNHPEARLSQEKNRAIAEKGRADVQGADEMLSRRERGQAGASHMTGTLDAEGAATYDQHNAPLSNSTSGYSTTGQHVPSSERATGGALEAQDTAGSGYLTQAPGTTSTSGYTTASSSGITGDFNSGSEAQYTKPSERTTTSRSGVSGEEDPPRRHY